MNKDQTLTYKIEYNVKTQCHLDQTTSRVNNLEAC